MKKDNEINDDFDFKAAIKRADAAKKAAKEARSPIVLADWDKEIPREIKNKPQPKISRESAELSMLGNILSSPVPTSQEQLDSYLAENKKRIHDAYVSSWSYKASQVKNFFVGIVESFNALINKANQLFPEPQKKKREEISLGDIELKTISKNEIEAELPHADVVPVAENLAMRHIREQNTHPIYTTTAVLETDNAEKFIEFAQPSDDEARKISTLQPLIENLQRAVSLAIKSIASMISHDYKAKMQETKPVEDGVEGTYAMPASNKNKI